MALRGGALIQIPMIGPALGFHAAFSVVRLAGALRHSWLGTRASLSSSSSLQVRQLLGQLITAILALGVTLLMF